EGANGALEFDPADPAVKENRAVKKAVDRILKLKKASLDSVVSGQGVPQSTYLAYIKSEMDGEGACLELPMTILILVSFAILAANLIRQDQIYAAEEAVGFDISENANFAWAHAFGHKGLQDTNSIADFWSWIRLGFLPLILQPSWSYSEAMPPAMGSEATYGTAYVSRNLPSSWLFKDYIKPAPVRNDYLRYLKVVGGFRLRQTIVQGKEEKCAFPPSIDRSKLQAWLGKPCVPSMLAALTPQITDSMEFDGMVRKQCLFPDLESLDDMKKVLLEMEDGCNEASAQGCIWCKEQTPRQPWIDEQTLRVTINFVTYNAQYGLYTYNSINFIFNRGGHIYKFGNFMSAFADPFPRPLGDMITTFIAGALWIGCLLHVLYCETKDVVKVIRSAKSQCLKALRDDNLGVWNMIDWISIVIGLTAVFFWIRSRLLVEPVNLLLLDMVQKSLNPPSREEYEAAAIVFHNAVGDMVLGWKDFNIVIVIYPMIIMLRLFKSFAAQPRLAIVTKTLESAAPDLMHFFLVFGFVFLCFVVNSILFFGQDLEDFSNFPRSLDACFQAMFSNDRDWDGMKEIGFMKAAVFFWAFSLIMVMILLNMLLAIIMDAYAGEKEKASNAETLMQQISSMIRRRRQFKKGERVRLNDVWNIFAAEFKGDEKAMLESDRMITPEYLVSSVPRMPFKQAHRTLVNSLQREQNIKMGHPTEQDTKEAIKVGMEALEIRSDQVRDDVEFMAETFDYFDRFQAPGDKVHDFYFGAEGQTPDDASESWIATSVTQISEELSALLDNGLLSIGRSQDEFEVEQTQLHL
ncbi:unnamed protein product, partial [Polarella glacialis]